MFGNGPAAPTHLTQVTDPWRERSVSIMESSCATRWYCAAVPTLRQMGTCGPATATSFPQRHGGNLLESDWRTTHEYLPSFPFFGEHRSRAAAEIPGRCAEGLTRTRENAALQVFL